MKHIIERVLELQETDGTPAEGVDKQSDPELKTLLKSLQPKIRVYGCGGCGSNTVARLELEGLFDDCLLYTSPSPRDKRQSRMPSSA